jgi:hypothetical protein
MKDELQHALDRMDAAIARPARKRARGFSTAPFVVAIGLILGYQLLTKLVPRVWANILPGGFDQGRFLQGGPNLVWRLAWFCHLNFPVAVTVVGVVTIVSVLVARTAWTRPIAWLMAVGVILLNAAILIITLKAGMDANGVGRVLG